MGMDSEEKLMVASEASDPLTAERSEAMAREEELTEADEEKTTTSPQPSHVSPGEVEVDQKERNKDDGAHESVAAVKKNRENTRDSRKGGKSTTKSTKASSTENEGGKPLVHTCIDLPGYLESLPEIIDFVEYDWEHFKNRYNFEQGRHIIEVLRIGPNILDEIEMEKWRRQGLNPPENQIKPNPASAATFIQRIRIQSDAILYHLRRVGRGDPSWLKTKSRIFLRPFDDLRYLQPRMKLALQKLERKWAEVERLDSQGHKEEAAAKEAELRDRDDDNSEGSEREDNSDMETTTSSDSDREKAKHTLTYLTIDNITALRHMRCYVKFIDDHVAPLTELFSGKSRKKVRFNDLGLLFNVGDIIYSPPTRSIFHQSYINYHPVWRVLHARRSRYASGDLDDINLHRDDGFHVCCYYIDYNGDSYGIVEHERTIYCFNGEKDITDLDWYPIRFAEDSERLRADLKSQGKMFQAFVKEHHLHYDGWTIPGDLSEEEESDSGSDSSDDSYRKARRRKARRTRTKMKRTHPREHIESAVIIDFDEAFKYHPAWKPNFTIPSSGKCLWSDGTDAYKINLWSDVERTHLLMERSEKTQTSEAASTKWKNSYLKSDKVITTLNDGDLKEVDGDDVMLLPRRLIAYALRERKFVLLDIFSLRNLIKQDDIFKDLKINGTNKRIVQSLVKAHFENRKLQKERPLIAFNQDLVYGKGSGLFILLHGVPGVGKTATAEAIAQSNNKPLFTITCGDLGFTPKEVETELKEIFRLAHLWDCVLLLDEADIFLAKREISNLKRNALVSVFLRVLEYYSGILFLTTNRVGTLDEAFKSRIHLSLYYERLTRKRTMAIFEVNIRKLKKIEEDKAKQLEGTGIEAPTLTIERKRIMKFAKSHWSETHPDARWNGRQIRNAFQIASSMARYDMGKNSLEDSEGEGEELDESGKHGESQSKASSPVLDETQFQLVADAITRFDTYFHLATGATDAEAARLDSIREDRVRQKDLAESRSRYNRISPSPVRRGSRRRQVRDDRGSKSDVKRGSRKSKSGATGSRRDNDDQAREPGPSKKKGTAAKPASSRKKGKASTREALSPPRTPTQRSKKSPSMRVPESARGSGHSRKNRRHESEDCSDTDDDDGDDSSNALDDMDDEEGDSSEESDFDRGGREFDSTGSDDDDDDDDDD